MSDKDNIVSLLSTPNFGTYVDDTMATQYSDTIKFGTTTIKLGESFEDNFDKMFADKEYYKGISYKYAEDKILEDLKQYLDKTYGQHYKSEEAAIECFDAWIALGDATPTFRNTALKYLWRYGKKNGNNKDDLMKVLHYTFMMLYNDFYKEKK